MQPRAPPPGLPSSPWSQEGGQTLWHESNVRESPLLRRTPPSTCFVSDAMLTPAHRALDPLAPWAADRPHHPRHELSFRGTPHFYVCLPCPQPPPRATSGVLKEQDCPQ